MTDFRLCELQNRRRQCRSFVPIMMRSPKKKKKVFPEILTFFLVKIMWSQKKKVFFRSKLGDLQTKKKVFTEILTVYSVKIRWSQKKWFSGLKCWFLSVISMGSFRAHEPSAGTAEASGLPEAYEPPKVHGPWGHCTLRPPSRWPWVRGNLKDIANRSDSIGSSYN